MAPAQSFRPHPQILRKLKALQYASPESFNPLREKEFRNMVVWLEDQKIRIYKIEERADLRKLESPNWMKAYYQYAQDVGMPIDSFQTPEEQVEWLLCHAIKLDYADNVEKYKNHTADSVVSNQSSAPKIVSSNPLDNLNSLGMSAGISTASTMPTSLSEYLTSEEIDEMNAELALDKGDFRKQRRFPQTKGLIAGQTDTVSGEINNVDNGDIVVTDNVKPPTDDVIIVTEDVIAVNDYLKLATDDVIIVTEDVIAVKDYLKLATDDVIVVTNDVHSATNITSITDNVEPTANDLIAVYKDVIAVTDNVKPATDDVIAVTDEVKLVNNDVIEVTDEVKPVNDDVIVVTDYVKSATVDVITVINEMKPGPDPIVVNDDNEPASNDVTGITDNVNPATDGVIVVSDDVVPAINDVIAVSNNVTPGTKSVMIVTIDEDPATDDVLVVESADDDKSKTPKKPKWSAARSMRIRKAKAKAALFMKNLLEKPTPTEMGIDSTATAGATNQEEPKHPIAPKLTSAQKRKLKKAKKIADGTWGKQTPLEKRSVTETENDSTNAVTASVSNQNKPNHSGDVPNQSQTERKKNKTQMLKAMGTTGPKSKKRPQKYKKTQMLKAMGTTGPKSKKRQQKYKKTQMLKAPMAGGSTMAPHNTMAPGHDSSQFNFQPLVHGLPFGVNPVFAAQQVLAIINKSSHYTEAPTNPIEEWSPPLPPEKTRNREISKSTRRRRRGFFPNCERSINEADSCPTKKKARPDLPSRTSNAINSYSSRTFYNFARTEDNAVSEIHFQSSGTSTRANRKRKRPEERSMEWNPSGFQNSSSEHCLPSNQYNYQSNQFNSSTNRHDSYYNEDNKSPYDRYNSNQFNTPTNRHDSYYYEDNKSPYNRYNSNQFNSPTNRHDSYYNEDNKSPYDRCNSNQRNSRMKPPHTILCNSFSNKFDSPSERLDSPNQHLTPIAYDSFSNSIYSKYRFPMKQHVTIAAWLHGYPEVNLVKDDLPYLERRMETFIRPLEDGCGPQFHKCCIENGRLVVTCDNTATQNWFSDCIRAIGTWGGVRLYVGEVNAKPKDSGHRVLARLPADMNRRPLTFILEKLAVQNKGIDTKKWTIVNSIKEESNGPASIVFSLEDAEFQAVKERDFKLFLCFSIILLQLKDQIPCSPNCTAFK